MTAADRAAVSRADQDLPAGVEDPAVLAQVAALLTREQVTR